MHFNFNIKDRFRMFFEPRIGKYYTKGYNGYRTLVIGDYHVCLRDCPHKSKCCTTEGVKEMDMNCPCYAEYKGRDERMCLHNSNHIEIEAFCNDEAGYPTYSTFTRYMVGKKRPLTTEEKYGFWDHVAFTNLMPYFVGQKINPTYAENPAPYDAAIRDIVSLIEELDPQVVYVWSQSACDAILYNQNLLSGLSEELIFPEHPTLEIHRFVRGTTTHTSKAAQIKEIIAKAYPNKCIIPVKPNWGKTIPIPLEEVLLRALKRNIITLDSGRCVINNEKMEREGGHLLHKVKAYYNIGEWKDMDQLFVKYSHDKPVSLRKIRHYNNNNEDNNLSQELDQALFGIRG